MKEANKVCTHIVDCINKTAPVVDFETPYKMIRTTNVKNGRINLDDARCVNEATFIKWNRRLTPQKKDIVLTREAPLGDVGLIRTSERVFLGQRTMLYRADPSILDQHFLYYTLQGPTLQAQLKTLGSGSTVEHVRVPDAEKLIIPFPPLPNQKKIAAILSAYDELIENNRRRIGLLEKMAEELYREWFVRFRFPNHQTTPFKKGIPQEWELVKIEKAFKFLGGGTPSKNKDAYWKDGKINWYTPSDITGSSGIFLSESKDKPNEEGLGNSSAKIFPANSIMMTSRATIGELGINRTEACTNQGFITCIPNEQYPLPYLFFWLKQSRDYFISLCGGATFPEISKGTFKRIEILTPPQDIIHQFKKLSMPIFDEIENLLLQNATLTRTKNALLPRLISGALSVEELEIAFPPGME
ncbi:restriction endonuclease subunit S [Pontiella agarivorans]|uniref:Restriction endonuclease subunit S n=1 Tax=Pontiella agarivorans TaxID=3038953 RepID=A0ABU5MYB5_9BACT|nr:restriction endonuclease subunit S [Pontiella agarivorans]MDZ8119180.1 restriction endonuclease subunit S [Pontiella agarivorans]